jgi:hypothetical protein
MSEVFRTPSRLESRIYSALIERQQNDGPLLSLSEVKARGRRLCVFEELVQIAPVGEAAKQPNFCGICHARILAENVKNAPVYWPGCPYAQFQNR